MLINYYWSTIEWAVTKEPLREALNLREDKISYIKKPKTVESSFIIAHEYSRGSIQLGICKNNQAETDFEFL